MDPWSDAHEHGEPCPKGEVGALPVPGVLPLLVAGGASSLQQSVGETPIESFELLAGCSFVSSQVEEDGHVVVEVVDREGHADEQDEAQEELCLRQVKVVGPDRAAIEGVDLPQKVQHAGDEAGEGVAPEAFLDGAVPFVLRQSGGDAESLRDGAQGGNLEGCVVDQVSSDGSAFASELGNLVGGSVCGQADLAHKADLSNGCQQSAHESRAHPVVPETHSVGVLVGEDATPAGHEDVGDGESSHHLVVVGSGWRVG